MTTNHTQPPPRPRGAHPPTKYPVPQRVVDRIMNAVAIGQPGECWLWKMSTGPSGYGQVSWRVRGGRTPVKSLTTAHRVVWIKYHGPIPPFMVIDHRCRVRRCCNPAHLRLMTNVENASRPRHGDDR